MIRHFQKNQENYRSLEDFNLFQNLLKNFEISTKFRRIFWDKIFFWWDEIKPSLSLLVENISKSTNYSKNLKKFFRNIPSEYKLEVVKLFDDVKFSEFGKVISCDQVSIKMILLAAHSKGELEIFLRFFQKQEPSFINRFEFSCYSFFVPKAFLPLFKGEQTSFSDKDIQDLISIMKNISAKANSWNQEYSPEQK